MNNKLQKELFSLIKKLEGSLLAISIEDEKVINEILKNNKINQSYNLKNKKKIKKEEGSEDITINKLGKKIKIKVNYLICDINGISYYLSKIIKQSYKLVDKKIIFYGISDDYDISKLVGKYKRYNCTYEINKYDDNYLVIIDITNIKIRFISKIINNIKDVFIDVIDAIGNGLMQ